MSNELDELARIIMSPEIFDGGPVSCGPNPVYAARTADAILAAGYRKPRTISTVAELDALPFESVVRDAEGYVLERWGDPAEQRWAVPMNGAYVLSADITLPATVLHEGATE